MSMTRFDKIAAERTYHPVDVAAVAAALKASWDGCSVRRRHTNPHLRETVDPIDGHSARVVLIALALKPGLSRKAIIYALTHDLGEHAVADFSYMVKVENPQLAAELGGLEDKRRAALGYGVTSKDLVADEAATIKIADWIDAYLWMLRHERGLRHRQDWKDQRERVLKDSEWLGVAPLVRTILDKATQEANELDDVVAQAPISVGFDQGSPEGDETVVLVMKHGELNASDELVAKIAAIAAASGAQVFY